MLGQGDDDWTLLNRSLLKAQKALYRHQIRLDLTEEYLAEPSPSTSKPDFSLFVCILRFYYNYRQIELEMLRYYPNEIGRECNKGLELDGRRRKMNVNLDDA